MTKAYIVWTTVFKDANASLLLSSVELLHTEEMRQTISLCGSDQWILILKIRNTSDIFIF